MVLFRILEPIFAILVIACLVSQCALPELLGQPWFPIFRRVWKVRRGIAEANEQISTNALEDKLHELKLKGEAHGVQPDSTTRPGGTDSSQRP